MIEDAIVDRLRIQVHPIDEKVEETHGREPNHLVLPRLNHLMHALLPLLRHVLIDFIGCFVFESLLALLPLILRQTLLYLLTLLLDVAHSLEIVLGILDFDLPLALRQGQEEDLGVGVDEHGQRAYPPYLVFLC